MNNFASIAPINVNQKLLCKVAKTNDICMHKNIELLLQVLSREDLIKIGEDNLIE